MKPRIVLFFVGTLVLIMGAAPLIAQAIPAAKNWITDLPPAGSALYQSILTILGVIALSYALRGEGKRIKKKEE